MTDVSVAVLVSIGCNSASGAARASRADLAALAAAQTISGSKLRVIHAGDPDEPALKDYCAYGFPEIEVLKVTSEDAVIPALVEAVRGVDLVLTGARAEAGEGSGLVPYALAQALNRPLIAQGLSLDIDGDGVHVRQLFAKGGRRDVSVQFPAIVSIDSAAETNLGYAYARRVAGRIVARETVAAGFGAPRRVSIVAKRDQFEVLRAHDERSGHERMMAATSPRARQGRVVTTGTAADKAQIILNYLRDNKLIDY